MLNIEPLEQVHKMIVILFGKLSIMYLLIAKKSYVPSLRYFNSAVNEKKTLKMRATEQKNVIRGKV